MQPSSSLLPAELIKPQQCLEWVAAKLATAGVFCGHGTDEVWDEAAHLVLHALGLPADATHDMLPDGLSQQQRNKVESLLRRRIEERLPLPYLTHEAWFMQFPFYVDQRVLVPRSPFASWIESGFAPWVKAPTAVQRILDIGTGSGSLAICCAMVFPNAAVDAVDISTDALEVAKRNVAHYQLQQRVHLLQSDCFATLQPQAQYDFIISNPPYVDADYLAELPDEYQHEPRCALHAEQAGLAICQQIMSEAAAYLRDDGCLFVEVGYNHAALQTLYPDLPLLWLECEQGGEGIFMLTKRQLVEYFAD